MLDTISRPIAVLLILWLGHPPVPCGHTHADLHGAPLARHLQQYHASAREADVPPGWHLHLLFPALAGPCDGQGRLAATEAEPAPEQRFAFPCPTSAWLPGSERTDVAAAVLAAPSNASAARAVFQQHLYQRLCVLLI